MKPSTFLIAGSIALMTFSLGLWIGSASDKPVSKTEYRAPQPPPVVTCSYPQEKDENGKCADLKEGRQESLSSGFVRVVNTDSRLVIFETDYGFIKTFEPYCRTSTPPVWVGMRLYQINFRWVPATDSTNGCYTFDYIGHSEHGDLETKMVPKQ